MSTQDNNNSLVPAFNRKQVEHLANYGRPMHADNYSIVEKPKQQIYDLKPSPHGEMRPVTASIVIVDGKLSLTYQAPVGSFKQDCELMKQVLEMLREIYRIKQIMCVGATEMPAIKGYEEPIQRTRKVIDI